MTRDEAQPLFSLYLEDALDPRQRDELQVFLMRDQECAAEMFALERTLSLLHRLPAREPALDIWHEFLPRVEEFKAQRKLGWSALVRLRLDEVRARISDGVILWTQAVSYYAQSRLSRYLHHDRGIRASTTRNREEIC